MGGPTDDFADYVDQLRSEDSEVFETALGNLVENSDSVKHDVYLIALNEKDPGVKGALIEVLGNSRDERYVPFLAKQLRADSAEVRFWAFAALQLIGTPEARRSCRRKDVLELLRLPPAD